MSSGRGHGGRNNGGRGGGRGRNRGSTSGKASPTKPKGQCKALGDHTFDYGQKGAADQARTTWEKIIIHAYNEYGQDIANELENRKKLDIAEPEYPQDAIDRHKAFLVLHNAGVEHLRQARQKEVQALKIAVSKSEEGAEIKLAELENQLALDELRNAEEPAIKLMEHEKTQMDNAWRNHRSRSDKLRIHRGQIFGIIKGQCQQVLLDKMKYLPEWESVNESADPLGLFNLIEKTVLSQTDDQYPPAIVYKQERSLFGFQQQLLTNEQYYESST